ncbi:hypothetical protein [Allokutzneria albata]|uniref:Uncharacterized protein n=1 Tax=Allokutzneria albata TaxID=211114 RepID=A0A1G9W435_ALLAB|nr:hypothetical protein [Allokutzneria albata]SDM78966.1 hypothetical protein SAMN04489726_3373 [Allokutzneria albata]
MNDKPRRKRSVIGTIVGVCAAVTVPLATTLGALGAALFVAAKHSGPEPAPAFGPNPVAEETIEGSGTTDRARGAERAL